MDQRKSFKKVFIALLMVGALLGLGYGVGTVVRHTDAATVTTPGTVPKDSGTPMIPGNFSDLAEKVRPGVVNVQVTKTIKNLEYGVRGFSGGPFGDQNPFGDFFGPFSQGNPPGGFETLRRGSRQEGRDFLRIDQGLL